MDQLRFRLLGTSLDWKIEKDQFAFLDRSKPLAGGRSRVLLPVEKKNDNNDNNDNDDNKNNNSNKMMIITIIIFQGAPP